MVSGYLKEAAAERARVEGSFKAEVAALDRSMAGIATEKREAAACVDARQRELDGLMDRLEEHRASETDAEYQAAEAALRAALDEKDSVKERHAETLNTHAEQLQHLNYVRNIITRAQALVSQHSHAQDQTPQVNAVLLELAAAHQDAARALAKHGMQRVNLRESPTVGERLQELLDKMAASFEKHSASVRALHESTASLHQAHLNALEKKVTEKREALAKHVSLQEATAKTVDELQEEVQSVSREKGECDSQFRSAESRLHRLQSDRDRASSNAEYHLSLLDEAIEEMEQQMEIGGEIVHLVNTKLNEVRAMMGDPAVPDPDMPTATGAAAMVAEIERRTEEQTEKAFKLLEQQREAEEAAKAAATGATGATGAHAAAEAAMTPMERMERELHEQVHAAVEEAAREQGGPVAASTGATGGATGAAAEAELSEEEKARREALQKRREELMRQIEELQHQEEDAKARERAVMGLKHMLHEPVTEELRDAVKPPNPVVVPSYAEEPEQAAPVRESTAEEAAAASPEVQKEQEEQQQRMDEIMELAGRLEGAQQSAENAANAADEEDKAAESEAAKEMEEAEQVMEEAHVDELVPTDATGTEVVVDLTDPSNRVVQPDESGSMHDATVGMVRSAIRLEGAQLGDFNAEREWGLARAVSKALGVQPDSVRVTSIVEVDRFTGEELKKIEHKAVEAEMATPVYKEGEEGETQAGAMATARRLLAALSLSRRTSASSMLRAGRSDERDVDVIITFDVQVAAKDTEAAVERMSSSMTSGDFNRLVEEEEMNFPVTVAREPFAVMVPVMLPAEEKEPVVEREAEEKAAEPEPEPVPEAAPKAEPEPEAEAEPAPEPEPKVVTKVEEVVRTVVKEVTNTVPDWEARRRAAEAQVELDDARRKLDATKSEYERRLAELRAKSEALMDKVRTEAEEDAADRVREIQEEEEHKREELIEARAKAEEDAREEHEQREEEASKAHLVLEQERAKWQTEERVHVADAHVGAVDEARERTERELAAQRLAMLAREKELRKEAEIAMEQHLREAAAKLEKAVSEAHSEEEHAAAKREHAIREEMLERLRKESEAVEREHTMLSEATKEREAVEERLRALQAELADAHVTIEQLKSQPTGSGPEPPAYTAPVKSTDEEGNVVVKKVELAGVENPELEAARKEAADAAKALSELQARLDEARAKAEAARKAAEAVEVEPIVVRKFSEEGAASGGDGANAGDMSQKAMDLLKQAEASGESVEEFLHDASMTGATGSAASAVEELMHSVQDIEGMEDADVGLMPGELSDRDEEAAVSAAGARAAAAVTEKAEKDAAAQLAAEHLRELEASVAAAEQRLEDANSKLEYEQQHAVDHAAALEQQAMEKKEQLDQEQRDAIQREFEGAEADRQEEHEQAVQELAEAKQEAEEETAKTLESREALQSYHKQLTQVAESIQAAREELRQDESEAREHAQAVVAAAEAHADALEAETEAQLQDCDEEAGCSVNADEEG